MRRALRILAVILVGTGLSISGYTFWSSHEGDSVASASQEDLRSQLTTTTTSTTTVPEVDNPTLIRPIDLSETDPFDPSVANGDPLGLLTFPTLDTEWVVVEGTGTEDLKLGPGHLDGTARPGREGNATISGHRTTYGAPFHDLHLLEAGDEILWTDDRGVVTYVVTEILIVKPTDFWVTEVRGEGKTLTLTTCNPIGSAKERLIVFADEIGGVSAGTSSG